MKPTYFLWLMMFLSLVQQGCRKPGDGTSQSVFVKLFPSDTSFQTGGAFQLADGNFMVYGFPPEDNHVAPILIITDPHGNIIKRTPLTPHFHYCTIKLIHDTIRAVGVDGATSDNINVCEISSDGSMGITKQYFVGSVRSGPLIPPMFVLNSAGELIIAGTIISATGQIHPFIMHVNADGTTTVFHSNLVGYMTRGICQDVNGITISGSTALGNNQPAIDVSTFYMRVNSNLQELWDNILTMPVGSISSKGVLESPSPTIILYGSMATGTSQNNTVYDLGGTLYTWKFDTSGVPLEAVPHPYFKYQNLAHAGEMIETSDGYILPATANELSDLHLVTGSHFYLLKLDKDLNEEWHKEFDEFNSFTAVSASQTSDKGYLVSGYEHSGTFLYTMCLIKTDANGNIVTEE